MMSMDEYVDIEDQLRKDIGHLDKYIDHLTRRPWSKNTAVNGQIRTVYALYFYRNLGLCFTTVSNENKAQNVVLYTVPYYGDQGYDGIRPVFVAVSHRIRRSYD